MQHIEIESLERSLPEIRERFQLASPFPHIILDDFLTTQSCEGLLKDYLAAETERRLPAVRRQTVKTCWPDYPDDPQAYGYTEEPLRLDPASARDVSDYEVALELSMLLDVEERRVLWAVVHSAAFRTRGAQWRALSRKMGVAAPTVRRRFEYAILRLWQLIGHLATQGVSNSA